MAVMFKHNQTGVLKECPEGFSWTYFFFGPLVALFRGMWTPFFVSFFTFGLANFYYIFAINKSYAEFLMEKGYVPVSDVDHQKLAAQNLVEPKAA